MKMENQTTPILVVEDDASHAELLCRHFEPHADRFELTVAHSLGKAKKYLAESKPALVITDVFLPDGEGTELGLSRPSPAEVLARLSRQLFVLDPTDRGLMGCLLKQLAGVVDRVPAWRMSYVHHRDRPEQGLDTVLNALSTS